MEMQEFDQHLCYQHKPVTQAKKNYRKFIFYDFETTQNEMISCDEGYQATGQRAKNVPRIAAYVTSVGSARIADSLGADLKSTK